MWPAAIAIADASEALDDVHPRLSIVTRVVGTWHYT